jgi:hypothetical protein
VVVVVVVVVISPPSIFTLCLLASLARVLRRLIPTAADPLFFGLYSGYALVMLWLCSGYALVMLWLCSGYALGY